MVSVTILTFKLTDSGNDNQFDYPEGHYDANSQFDHPNDQFDYSDVQLGYLRGCPS